jgi:hypothetical protein
MGWIGDQSEEIGLRVKSGEGLCDALAAALGDVPVMNDCNPHGRLVPVKPKDLLTL